MISEHIPWTCPTCHGVGTHDCVAHAIALREREQASVHAHCDAEIARLRAALQACVDASYSDGAGLVCKHCDQPPSFECRAHFATDLWVAQAEIARLRAALQACVDAVPFASQCGSAGAEMVGVVAWRALQETECRSPSADRGGDDI